MRHSVTYHQSTFNWEIFWVPVLADINSTHLPRLGTETGLHRVVLQVAGLDHNIIYCYEKQMYINYNIAHFIFLL